MSAEATKSIEERIAEAIERIELSGKISDSSKSTQKKSRNYSEFIRSEK